MYLVLGVLLFWFGCGVMGMGLDAWGHNAPKNDGKIDWIFTNLAFGAIALLFSLNEIPDHKRRRHQFELDRADQIERDYREVVQMIGGRCD